MLALGTTLIVATPPARAAPVLVPMAPLVADGTSQGTVRLLLAADSRPKVRAPAGETGPLYLSADGVVSFPFVPPAVDAPGFVDLVVDDETGTYTVEVPVVPGGAGSLDVRLEPLVVSGTDGAIAQVTVRAPAAGARAPAERRISLTANLGTVSAAVPAGDLAWTATYSPPAGMPAAVPLVIVATDAADPAATGHVIGQVTGRRTVTFPAPAGSANALKLGASSFGPVVATAQGRAVFENVDLDLRWPTGTLVTVATSGAKTETQVPMPGTVKAHLFWLAPPAAVPASRSVTLRLAALGSAGTPSGAPAVSASGGTVGEARAEDGAYTVSFTPAADASSAWVEATHEDATARATFRVLPVPAWVEASTVAAKAGTTLILAVRDAAGAPVIGRPPVISSVGGRIGALRDPRDGTYTATVTVDGSADRAWVVGVPAAAPSGLAPARLVAWPVAPLVPVAGETVLVVAAVDAWGGLVPDVPLALEASAGQISATARTEGHGLALVRFRAGAEAGLSAVRISGAGLCTEVAVVQGPDGPLLPPTGAPQDDQARLAIAERIAVTSIAREASTAGPAASARFASSPPFASPKGALWVTARLLDAEGRGVNGAAVAPTVNIGTVRGVRDHGDGTYTFRVDLPSHVDAPVTIQLPGVAGEGLVPRLGETIRSRSPSARARVERPVKESPAALRRVGVLVTNAHGTFSQRGNGEDVLLGSADYGTPLVGFAGLRADVLAWPLRGRWGALGVEVRAEAHSEWVQVLESRFTRFPLEGSAHLRYGFDLGPLRLGVLGGVDLWGSSVLGFTDPTRMEPDLVGLSKFGPRLGPSVQLDTGPVYVNVAYAHTFVASAARDAVDAIVEVGVGDAVGLRGGLTLDRRRVDYATEGALGTATIEQLGLVAAVGFGLRY